MVAFMFIHLVEGDGIPSGEAIIFSGLTLHRSKLNRTDKNHHIFSKYADVAAQTEEGSDLVWQPNVYVLLGGAPLPALPVFEQAKQKPLRLPNRRGFCLAWGRRQRG